MSLSSAFTVRIRRAVCLGLMAALLLGPAMAQAQRMPKMNYIRDAEIEHYLRTLATPLMRAAAIEPSSVNFVLIQSTDLNAFVAEGMNVFVYTGLLQATDTPDQLAGVLAHELGHISGGHLIRGRDAMRNASAEAILGMLAGVAAGVLSKDSRAGAAAIGGAQELAKRNFLTFSRAQESSADAAALHFLDSAGFSSQGMLEFLEKLAGQELLPTDRQVEFVRTHPLTQDRIDTVAHHVESSPLTSKKIPAEFTARHERMKAKLMGFLQPETALLRYTDKDSRVTARYARAIALYRTNKLPRALALIDALIAEEPNNAFFHELRGQMLYENSRVAESVASYGKAVALAPDLAVIRTAYAQALLESKTPDSTEKAIAQLQESLRLEENTPLTWRLMATAWGRKGQESGDKTYDGMVIYALAEEAQARGADKDAAAMAERAQAMIPKDSPYWIRAQDIRLSTDKEEEPPHH